jgi:putative transposase
MLFKNEIFLLNGARHRLLHVDALGETAWVIDLTSDNLLTFATKWESISNHNSEVGVQSQRFPVETTSPAGSPAKTKPPKPPLPQPLQPTPAMEKVRDLALKYLGNLIHKIPDIFDPELRGPLVLAQAQEAGCSIPTIYKHLRQYLAGGQTPSALLGRFHRCGRSDTKVSGGRGQKPKYGRKKYQLIPVDFLAFEDVIKNVYLKDVRVKMPAAYQTLNETHYQFADGNDELLIRPECERPTFKQFEYYLRKHYPLQVRLRKRMGDKDFNRDHREILGTVLADCRGVGHYYEADATIADVYLVAADNVEKIVGKPTIYLIMDRKSRLIVGWYVGLENASWICAMQAMFSISQDKQQLCARLGVKYDPEDWPADQIFPREFLADRSELLTKTSNQIADDLGLIVTNVPSKRPDWKPVVECEFKQTRMILQDRAPGFDPPENAKKRQGKHYEKDACLTLAQFEAIILLAVIRHNRSPIRAYELSLKEIGNNVLPIPTALWNHDIVTQAGSLPRYSEERVRMALLPRDEGTVSEHGIEFGGCFYTCPEALEQGWFVQGRKKRFKLTVSYDRRLVDTVYVHDRNRKGSTYKCKLTPFSEKYAGKSLAEVFAMEKFQTMLIASSDQARIQGLANYHNKTELIIDIAKATLKAANLKTSRTARRADIREDRAEELRVERKELAAPAQAESVQGSGKVVSLENAKKAKVQKSEVAQTQSSDNATEAVESTKVEPKGPADAEAALKERLNKMKQRMFRG